jgi:hypothetical protein
MRQAVLILVIITVLVLCAGCGGSKSSSTTAEASIAMSPSSLSLNQGDVLGITATVLDSNGAAATNPKAITYTTDNAAVATVTSGSGGVCGGVWDANNIVCAPGQIGTAKITATSGTLTNSITVYVHKKVDRVAITTPTSVCKSVGQTLQLSAAAFSNGVDVTSTVGPFSWGTNTVGIANVDANGLLTALAPGAGAIFASVSNVSSVPTIYTTCGVRSIHLHASGATNTAFTLGTLGATQQLAADVVDTAGLTISPTLNFVSNGPGIATVTSAGLVTANTPGTAGVIAECTGSCNAGLPPVYSDVAVATVSGTNATTVYATGTGTTQLIPIDSATHAAGTAIVLSAQPNSILFAPLATSAYLGSSSGFMTLNAVGNSVTQNTSFPGKVIAVSPDGNRALIADTNAVYSINFATTGSTETLSISGATAAAFFPDSSHAYIIGGGNLYVYTPGSASTGVISIGAAAKDVGISPSGAFGFIANGVTNSIIAKATCDNSGAGTFNTPGTPTQLGFTPDGAKIIAADSPGIDVLTRGSLAQPGCPPPLSAAVTSANFGLGAFTANQMVVTTDGTKAYIVSNLPGVMVYNVTTGATSTIALANGASGLSASATLDGTQLYVGGSDNNVHVVDTVAGADTVQIPVGFTPNLVAVRPK